MIEYVPPGGLPPETVVSEKAQETMEFQWLFKIKICKENFSRI
jgi:hypothetical protein